MLTIHHATYWDLLLAPVYILIFFVIIIRIRARHYQKDPYLGKKLIQGFWLKVIAAILYVFLIQFYYGYGDSFNYNGFSQIMHKAIMDNPTNIRFLFLHETEPFSKYLQNMDVGQYNLVPEYMYNNLGNQAIVKLDCFLGFFCFQNYTVVSLMFTMLSYIGVWKIYTLLDKVFRNYRKYVAFSFIMLPSFVFWCSGILKEAVCVYAEGIICFTFFRWMLEKKTSFKWILLSAVSAYLLLLVKSYILLALFAGFGTVILTGFLKKINVVFKIIIAPIVAVGLFFVVTKVVESVMGAAIEEATSQIVSTSQMLQEGYESTGGSFVGSVNLDPSVGGLVKAVPNILNTVFFRPYVWETKNPVMLLSALESLAIMFLFLKLVLKSRIIFIMKRFTSHPFFVFSIIFALVLGMIVGFTTFNFGTIVRYKMPVMPFLCLTLLIVNSYYSTNKRSNQSVKYSSPDSKVPAASLT